VYRIDLNLALRGWQKNCFRNFSLIHSLSFISLKLLKKVESNIKNYKFKLKLEKYIAKQNTIQLNINVYIINAIFKFQKNEYRKNLLLGPWVKKFLKGKKAIVLS